MSNPWNLTPGQARALDAICEHGSFKAAAHELGVSECTIEAHSSNVKKRMGARTLISMVLTWDRWRRGAK